ncbi:MAG: flagellar M-ring protein FliF [Sulfobacillus thermosulfidooxidans]|uniref:Flagellar M-ring protein n=1 Tax=Sulfobacillus thermotolerans TaxID=338644 RepID=A0ABM6RUF5_9FIRM|nr:flagellar basal-body MS-ring/collar protein FliF [Sulfobacillus sp. hq2]AUW94985.1 flagellar M-ring protein FliF [Sulfobacillus thermotolerans]MCY0909496.1 flagellar basal-body MS-ring/collar protein FliF [Sulfobacillus thermotolerans]POB10412.1 flagellar M-ring protein FliF [Sulfobacillus sp. hq2]PSR36680.1 MAG: flagellar M-ring protein FliF [Sulfobacillus thermosulfidooxidans]
MNERIKQWGQRLVAWWKNLSSTKRLRLLVIVAMAASILVVVGHWVTSPDWQPLYTNLSARTAGQITTQLTSMKVPYELADQGRTVLVPKKDVDQVRVDLADQNIPSGTVGLPQPLTFSLGETDQEITLSQLANVEAELEATINSINGVHDSRVLINEPSPALFGESTAQPTASVFLDLNPGANLSGAQVKGIMNLVAHSVSGLSPAQVTVVDQTGALLSQNALNNQPSSQITGTNQAELAAEDQVDSQIAQNVTSMLDQVLGPGAAVVRVNATLNFDQSTVSSTNYGKAVLSSQQVTTNTSTQAAGATTQTAGAGGNTPTYPVTTSGTGPSKSTSNSTISHWLVDTQSTHQVIPAGSINRMTVAVAVDKPLTAAQSASLKNLVAAAAGVDKARGDVVTILGQPFNRSQVNLAEKQMAQAARAAQIRQDIMDGLILLGILAAGVIVWRWAKKAGQQAALQPRLEPQLATGGSGSLSVTDLLNEMRQTKEPSLTDVAKSHLQELLQKDPESAARLIRAWIQEDD